MTCFHYILILRSLEKITCFWQIIPETLLIPVYAYPLRNTINAHMLKFYYIIYFQSRSVLRDPKFYEKKSSIYLAFSLRFLILLHTVIILIFMLHKYLSVNHLWLYYIMVCYVFIQKSLSACC